MTAKKSPQQHAALLYQESKLTRCSAERWRPPVQPVVKKSLLHSRTDEADELICGELNLAATDDLVDTSASMRMAV